MGLFDKIREPVFLKEDSSAETQLLAFQELAKTATGALAERLEQEIKCVEAGIFGENAIKYELRNSHIPMFVLHDLYLEHEGLSAQIDFLIVTRKHQYIVECKNLYGDIEITSSGDFVRTVSFGHFKKKEGIYSPITQNKRHLELIKQIRRAERNNFLTKALFESNFYNNYRSIVVLANPKTVLNAKYAKKEVKDQVIRADQLSEYIRRTDADPKAIDSSEKEMETLARYFLSIHKPQEIDYTDRFRDLGGTTETPDPIAAPSQNTEQILCPKCGAVMIRRKATKGPNAGGEFYGCSNFPKCRGIIAIK